MGWAIYIQCGRHSTSRFLGKVDGNQAYYKRPLLFIVPNGLITMRI